MKLGIELLLQFPALRKPLKNRRIAVLAHPASVMRDLTHSLDALAALDDIAPRAAFGPQHGLRGDKQDNMVESLDFLDPVHGIPVFSLYGETRRPTKAMLDYFDVLLVDLVHLAGGGVVQRVEELVRRETLAQRRGDGVGGQGDFAEGVA